MRIVKTYCLSWLRCVSFLGPSTAVTMARQIKMKFSACTLHLQGMDEIQRAAKSSEHADSMVALIGSAALNNSMEKDDVLNSIVLSPNRNVWVAKRLVESGSGSRGT